MTLMSIRVLLAGLVFTVALSSPTALSCMLIHYHNVLSGSNKSKLAFYVHHIKLNNIYLMVKHYFNLPVDQTSNLRKNTAL